MVNAERFVTPQLEEYEAKIVGAEERLRALEFELFNKLVAEIAAQQSRLSRTAAAVARLDVFCALATTARAQPVHAPAVASRAS